MRKMLMIVAALALIAGVVSAKEPARQASKDAGMHYDFGRYLFEGFEAAVPPAGWGAVVNTPTNTWQQGTSPYEGNFEARIPWTATYVQNEALTVSYTVQAGDHLFFYTMGSQYWATNANFTVLVDGNLEYDFLTDPNYPGSFTYFLVDIDLAAYVGMTVTVEFVYAGTDGADHHFDAVVFGDTAWTPPPPPDVDFCGMVEDASGTGLFFGDTCDGMNLVEALGCEAYGEAGLEDYYEIEIAAGGTFTATVTNTADGALWVLGECIAPNGAFTCLAYADATFTGDAEVVTYTNTSGSAQTVYLVVDSWGAGSCGTYEMDFQGTGAVANEYQSFGQIKSTWR